MIVEKKVILSEDLYPLQAIQGAAYVFIDRVYIFFDRNKNGKISIRFRKKNETKKEDFEKIMGEFENELLAYALRVGMSKHTKKMREMIIEKALYSSLIEE